MAKEGIATINPNTIDRDIGITNDDILLVGSFGDGLIQIDPYSIINYSKLRGFILKSSIKSGKTIPLTTIVFTLAIKILKSSAKRKG